MECLMECSMVGYSPSNTSISGVFLKFPNFLRSEVVFFSCVGTKAPPSAKMPWGYLSVK